MLVLFSPLFLNQITLAEPRDNNVVEPILLIPEDWKARVTTQLEEEYKEEILNALGKVQIHYSEILPNNLTFKFEPAVKVKRVGKFTEFKTSHVMDLLQKNGITLDKPPSNKIFIYFVVGSRDLEPVTKCVGCREAFVNHQALDDLIPTDDSVVNLGTNPYRAIEHELGHAFGLSIGGAANGHTCSVLEPDHCKEEVRQKGNYPPPSECTNSFMSYCNLNKFDIGLNNTLANPEVHDILTSTFINPGKIEAPKPVPPNATRPKVSNFFPNDVTLGRKDSEITILGSGFGKGPNNPISPYAISLISEQNLDSNDIGFYPIEWNDSKIVARLFHRIYSVPGNEYRGFKYPTSWYIYIKTENGDASPEQMLTIIPPIVAPLPSVLPTPTPTPIPTQTPVPSPTANLNVPAGKVHWSDNEFNRGCIAKGGTTCIGALNFQSLCTESGGISLGQGQSVGCFEDSICCKYVTSCESLTGQCTSVNDPKFRSEPTHDRVFGYCSTDLYDSTKSGDESILCWNKPGQVVLSPTPVASINPTPTPTPTVSVSPISSADIPCGDGGICRNGACLVGDSIDPNGVCPLVQTSTPTPTPVVVQKKQITKITAVTDDGKVLQEIDPKVSRSLSFRLPVVGTNNIIVHIYYDDGTERQPPIPFIFSYRPPDVTLCSAKGGECQASCSSEQDQVGVCSDSSKPFCCAKKVAVPSSNASKCQGSGPAASGWGGSCKVGEPDKTLLVSGGTACSIASCYLNPDINEYCWYNSGTPYPDYKECEAKGVIISTPIPASTTSTSTSGFSKTGPCYQPGYDSDIVCNGNPFGAGGQCDSLNQQSAPISCTKTCPDGRQIIGTSVSTCGSDGCYTNSCSCSANCNLE